MKTTLFTSFLLGLFLIQSSIAEVDLDRPWMRISDPLIMSTTFNRQFSALPLSGKVKDPKKYWSSDYWARSKGGINYRWNAARPTGFNLKSPTKEEALQMSVAELSALAPSEKWDIFIGRYDYPTKNEVAAYAQPGSASWEGICDGWSGASMNQSEPVPVTVTNPDGVKVPFGSSDIKGLLSWYYARKFSGGYAMMGYRCNENFVTSDRCNDDMNAGAFHLVLSNRLGVDGNSFIADIDRKIQVWNHVAYSYKSTIRSSHLPPLSSSAPGTVEMVKVRTVVSYVYLLSRNSWTPVLGTSRQILSSRTYDYYLDLDNTGHILGGEWISTQRPDFLWLEKKAPGFTGLFSRLGEIIPAKSED